MIAFLTASIFGILCLLHVHWAFGGRIAFSGVPEKDGRPLFTPSRSATLFVAVLLALAALVVLERAAVGPGILPMALVRPATWTLAAVMLARSIGDFRYVGFFKRVRGSRFAQLDTRFYSPLCLLLALATAWVALDRV